MAVKKEVDFVFEHLMKNQSFELLKLFYDANTGIGAVLRILKNASSPVSARKISEIMCVSEARLTVLLRKMQERGYIVREKDECDARVTFVKLTNVGETQAERLRDVLCDNIATVIDTVGFEKIEQFVRLTEEIDNAVRNRLPAPPEIK